MSEMVEHKKALKIKITMQSPKTPAATEARKREPRLVLPAFVGLALGVAGVLVWWGFTGAKTDEEGKEVAALDTQLMLERPVTSPSPATPDTEDRSLASPIDQALSETLPERESTPAQPKTETRGRVALPQASPTPIQAVPTAEKIGASAGRGSTALTEAEPQQVTENPPDIPVPGPQAASERLAAVAPSPSSKESAAPPLTSDTAYIARALFTSAIKGGQPTDTEGPVIFSRGTSGKSLYFFTELRGLKGRTVTHRWEYQGETMLTIPFKIGGNRWRVYSNKNLPTKMTGTWRVVVGDSTGAVLAAKEFRYQKR